MLVFSGQEYALADLSFYKEGRIGLRWRTEAEVVEGKGQFMCGNITKRRDKKGCSEREPHLHSYELNFAYLEHGQKKNELVKVRVCRRCAEKLNYYTSHKKAPKAPKAAKEAREKGGSSGPERNDGRKRRGDTRDCGKTEASSSSTKRHREQQKGSLNRGAAEEPAERGRASDASSADAALQGTSEAWSGDAPKAKTEEDEMDMYLQGLFP